MLCKLEMEITLEVFLFFFCFFESIMFVIEHGCFSKLQTTDTMPIVTILYFGAQIQIDKSFSNLHWKQEYNKLKSFLFIRNAFYKSINK